MFRGVGLYNTHVGLILAHLTLNLPIALWLMTVFVREVPRELEEAALIDGCTIPQVIWRVIVPLVRVSERRFDPPFGQSVLCVARVPEK